MDLNQGDEALSGRRHWTLGQALISDFALCVHLHVALADQTILFLSVVHRGIF